MVEFNCMTVVQNSLLSMYMGYTYLIIHRFLYITLPLVLQDPKSYIHLNIIQIIPVISKVVSCWLSGCPFGGKGTVEMNERCNVSSIARKLNYTRAMTNY